MAGIELQQIGPRTAKITTKPCEVCGKRDEVIVDKDAAARWLVEGERIQDVFSGMTPEQREHLVSGTHPDCWVMLYNDMLYEDEGFFDF